MAHRLRHGDKSSYVHNSSDEDVDAGSSLLTALALVLVVEGLLPFLSPRGWRSVFEQILKLSDGQIRFYGLCSIFIGAVALAFLA